MLADEQNSLFKRIIGKEEDTIVKYDIKTVY
jgi:hypothetical protein